MIRQDRYSKMLIVVALGLSVYLFLNEPNVDMLFPSFLLISGIAMELFLEKRREHTDEPIIDALSKKKILYYTAISLGGMFLIGGLIKKYLPLEISPFGIIAYSMLLGIAEEQFFRGFITDLMLTMIPHAMTALLAAAMIFLLFHFPKLGMDYESWMYIFAGGFILSWAAYKSRRISPSMNAHALNNLFAALTVIKL